MAYDALTGLFFQRCLLVGISIVFMPVTDVGCDWRDYHLPACLATARISHFCMKRLVMLYYAMLCFAMLCYAML